MAKKGILLILDGYGEGENNDNNAVMNAKTPFLHSLKKNYPSSFIKTDGEAVGLFNGEMGGSEVGHTTIGAGRIVPSTAKKIHDDILSGKFRKNKKILDTFKKIEKHKANLHLIGMISDKNIHSDIKHLYELMTMTEFKDAKIFLHLITDGRDCGSFDSLKYLKELKKHLKSTKNAEIASLSGRFYAMDREGNLDRTEIAFDAMFNKKDGLNIAQIEAYIKEQHDLGVTDEFINPIHFKTKNEFAVNKNDVLFFFNFREDRLRQICNRCDKLSAKMITMSFVDGVDSLILYGKIITENTLSEHLSKLGLKQVKISESTKYAHVTYFLNGGREASFDGEDRIHIPTIKTENFAKTPHMRAKEITKAALKSVNKKYDAVIVNYSNPDMIGHTGDYNAVIKSLEFLDKCVKKLVTFALKHDYFLIVTADHGNAEMMKYKNGESHTSHTLNKVACTIVDTTEHKLRKAGELKDIAPTFLDLMQVENNSSFEGSSLIKK